MIIARDIFPQNEILHFLLTFVTFNELKETIKQDIPIPSYLEIDSTYMTAVDKGNYSYNYVWSNGNYDTEKCDFVTITKK